MPEMVQELKAALTFRDGLVGYPEWQHFQLQASSDSPVAWLHGQDEEGVSFLVTEPSLVCPTFSMDVPWFIRASLGLKPGQEPGVLCMLVIQPDAMTITANLLGPIVYNPDSGEACQLVLAESSYSPRHPVVMPGAQAQESGAAC